MRGERLNKALELVLEPSGPCPDGEALYRFAASACPAQERQAIETHILSCAACMETWREARALFRASCEEQPRMGTSSPITLPHRQVPSRRQGHRVAPWAAAALAAGLAGIFLAGGWAAITLSSLRREIASLKGIATHPAQPAVAALLDLSPESLRVRGAEPQAPVLDPGALPSILVLNPLTPYEVPVSIALLGGDGQVRWSTFLREPPLGPVTLLVPPGLLPPGVYTAEVKATATGALLDRYPFQVQ